MLTSTKGCLLRFANVGPTLIKKLSKLKQNHDMACKKKSDKFALLMWDTIGTGRGHFLPSTKLPS